MKLRLSILFTLLILLISSVSAQETSESFPIEIEHELGTTTIDAVPERIVILEYSFADHLGTLGVAPVGFAVDAPPEYIYEYTTDVGAIEVGTRAEPNLEAILELDPDFIIGDLRRHEEIYDQLSLIAPTVIFNSLRGSYEDQLEQFSIIAQILGKTDEADEILASYHENFDSTLASTNIDAGEVVIGVLWSGGFTAHSNESFMGSFLESLGRTNALEPQEGESQYLIDMEGFASVNPSTIVILCNSTDQEFLDDMTESSLWQAFDAVTNNRVYTFDRNLWSKGRGITAYEKILADSVNSGLLADTESQSAVCGGHDMTGEEMLDDVFPVSIDHKFGSTTLEQVPERIVVLGFTEQDPYFALGVQPIAIRYWYGDAPNAIFPWAVDAAEGAEPVVLEMPFGTLNYEAILELEPDLISAVDAGITQDEYDALSQIAPTLAQSDDYVDFGMPWQATTRLIGLALGKADEAEALISDVEGQVEELSALYPDFEGQTVSVSYDTGDSYGFYTGQDSRGRFFTDLGFVIPEEYNELAGESFYYYISLERVDLLDQDLLVFLALQFSENGSEAAREEIESDALLGQLSVVQDGRVLYVADEYDDALQFSTVLSLPYLYDNLVPEIADVLGIADMEAMMNANCEVGLRAVEDAIGNVICLPEQVERVISLTDGDTDALIALGIDPVGISNGRGSQTPPNYLLDFVSEDYTSVGGFFQPNLETVLSLDPDVILFSYGDFAEPELIEQLNEIAPVFVPVSGNGTWQDLFVAVGDALNMSPDVETYMADYETRVAELGEQIEPETQFIIARWAAEGPQVMAPYIFAPAILQELGMVMPEEVPELQEGHAHSAPLSLETVDILDSDWAFVGTLQPVGDAAEALEEVFDNPLWQQLEVVQNEHVVVVDGSIWTSSGGPLAANLVLDVVESTVIGE